MSPRVLKRPRVVKGAVSFPRREAAKAPSARAESATPEETLRERSRWIEEARRGLESELQAAVRAEIERLRRENETAREKEFDALEPEIVRLVLSVTARVCRQTSAVSADGVLEWVREGLAAIPGGERRVRVHPLHVDAVKGAPEVRAPGVVVRADDGLLPGDVVVDAGPSQWDGRLETRLEELERSFTRLAEEQRREP
jgi:flagellar biosynthesis/type III secretory pathway protein FliH